MHLIDSLASSAVPIVLNAVPATRAEIMKTAGDQAAAAARGSVRGTKGSGPRR